MPIDREHQDHRRKAILELLATTPMRRQIDIGRALRRMGFKITQSSVSRDLQAMGIVRKDGVYRPPAPKGDEGALGKVEEFIQKVQNAGPHMIIFDTKPGMAKAVAVSLKSAAWPEVRGVLAEDDTIFVATDNIYDTRLLLQRLRRLIKV